MPQAANKNKTRAAISKQCLRNESQNLNQQLLAQKTNDSTYVDRSKNAARSPVKREALNNTIAQASAQASAQTTAQASARTSAQLLSPTKPRLSSSSTGCVFAASGDQQQNSRGHFKRCLRNQSQYLNQQLLAQKASDSMYADQKQNAARSPTMPL